MSLDQRRPSASLRARRPSTVYNDQDGQGQPSPPEVPGFSSSNHLALPYSTTSFRGPSPNGNHGHGHGNGTGNDTRPSMRHGKSSGSDISGSRSRSRNAGAPGLGPPPIGGGADSKVGAILLNKRQSVSFGKGAAAHMRANVRQDVIPSMPEAFGGPGAAGRYKDPMGRNGMDTPGGGFVGGRRGATLDGSTAGEDLIAKAPSGPTGNSLQDLLKEDFIADAFLKTHLSPEAASSATSQLEDLRKLKVALNHMLDSTQTNLQTNIIENYTEFIKVSKDIGSLENEMLELKSVLEEWKTVPEGLEIEQSFDPNASTGRNRRNSLLDLQALYKTQLEGLWDAVEGSQRFLPATIGRHVIGRHNGWIELNSATYRPRQGVILVLLNDALLVAIEKRRQMGRAVRVVADKCFQLSDIAVTDLKDAGELTNAIRVKRDREVHIFRTEKAEDKKSLLLAFKKILEDTMSRKRKESVWEAEVRRDTGSYGSLRNGSAPTKHPLAGFQPSTFFPFVTSNDSSGKDLSWIDDISDQLVVHIALREFERAVSLIERSKSVFSKIEADPLAENLLRSKIELRSNELCSVLLANLADTSIRKTGVVKLSGLLLRLGQGERARETFLSGRGELLKLRTGEIRFSSQGDGSASDVSPDSQALIDEIAELAFVCFTVIRNTCEWYMAAYKDHQTASAFVRWASAQVEVFAGIFKRQVFANGLRDLETRQRCVETATLHAAMLKDVGLDFAFLLSSRLSYEPPPLPPRDVPDPDMTPARPLNINKRKSGGEVKNNALPLSSSRPNTPLRPGTPQTRKETL